MCDECDINMSFDTVYLRLQDNGYVGFDSDPGKSCSDDALLKGWDFAVELRGPKSKYKLFCAKDMETNKKHVVRQIVGELLELPDVAKALNYIFKNKGKLPDDAQLEFTVPVAESFCVGSVQPALAFSLLEDDDED